MPKPYHYAVIFTSRLSKNRDGYDEMAEKMINLAKEQNGFLGVESARNEDGFGITVSYWKSLDAIREWKEDQEHKNAQELGKSRWYEQYQVKICRVENEYGQNKSLESNLNG